MKNLQRTSVDKFCMEDAVKLDDLNQDDVISVETLCTGYPQINLDDRKLELFLNGVMLTFHKSDGIYIIYHAQKFVGLGRIKNELLKRDIII